MSTAKFIRSLLAAVVIVLCAAGVAAAFRPPELASPPPACSPYSLTLPNGETYRGAKC